MPKSQGWWVEATGVQAQQTNHRRQVPGYSLLICNDIVSKDGVRLLINKCLTCEVRTMTRFLYAVAVACSTEYGFTRITLRSTVCKKY